MAIKNDGELAVMNAIKGDDNVKELIPKITPSKQLPVNIKALCIILAYMLRMNELDKTSPEELEFILQKTPYLIE
jgi:hypothetical protein